jgi:hypothetical protein
MLKSLGEERFLTLLANWHRGVHGKFKVPVFAHRELDLYKVFWSVMDKGGYEVVSSNKQWKVRKVLRLVFRVHIPAASALPADATWLLLWLLMP